jgi:hypothetical protein
MKYEIEHGGLMRCCISSIDNAEKEGKTAKSMRCKFCKNPMLKDADNTWRWDKEQCMKDSQGARP